MAENTDPEIDEYENCIGDKNLIEKVTKRIDLLKKKLQKAQDQGTILEQRLIQLETLNSRVASSHSAICYNIRLKLSIYNGVKMMFYRYAERHFTEMQKLQHILGFLQVSTRPPSQSITHSFGSMNLSQGDSGFNSG